MGGSVGKGGTAQPQTQATPPAGTGNAATAAAPTPADMQGKLNAAYDAYRGSRPARDPRMMDMMRQRQSALRYPQAPTPNAGPTPWQPYADAPAAAAAAQASGTPTAAPAGTPAANGQTPPVWGPPPGYGGWGGPRYGGGGYGGGWGGGLASLFGGGGMPMYAEGGPISWKAVHASGPPGNVGGGGGIATLPAITAVNQATIPVIRPTVVATPAATTAVQTKKYVNPIDFYYKYQHQRNAYGQSKYGTPGSVGVGGGSGGGYTTSRSYGGGPMGGGTGSSRVR